MLRIFQSLGRLSVRGYLVIAGFVALTLLLNYSSWQNQLNIAARQAQKHAREHAASNETLSLSEANSAAAGATASGGSAPATTPAAINNNAVQAARTLNGGSLVFSPASITLSLGAAAPLVTVSAPDGAAISSPVLSSDPTQSLSLTARNSADGVKATWPMQLTGKPAPGTYKLQVRATATQGADTVEYTGSLTLIVLL